MSFSDRMKRQKTEEIKPVQPVPSPPQETKPPAEIVEHREIEVPPKRIADPHVQELRRKIRGKLLANPDEADEWQRDNPEHQRTIVERLRTFLQRANVPLTRPQYEALQTGILDDLLGFGTIDPLIRDESVSEVMVNRHDQIFIERKGKLIESDLIFDDDEHVMWVAQRIVRRIGRSFDRSNPMTDARLPDGSRVHLLMPPAALDGTAITIRKFPAKPLTVDDLISWGSFTQEVAMFLEACVLARLNMVVSGGTGSGKTTLLNVLSSYLPNDQRIITIEDSAELRLNQRHVVSLETSPPIQGSKDGTGQLTIRDLVRGSMRMRPDRLVIGECRSGEALDMLQAMNTGQDGVLTTVHANSPRDAVARLETLVMMAGMDLPVWVIRRQIAAAVNLIIQQSRMKDGSRKITQITELQGMEGEQVTLQDVFVYRTEGQTGPGPSYMSGGRLQPTGFRPNFMERLEDAGFKLGAKIFGVGGQKFTHS